MSESSFLTRNGSTITSTRDFSGVGTKKNSHCCRTERIKTLFGYEFYQSFKESHDQMKLKELPKEDTVDLNNYGLTDK